MSINSKQSLEEFLLQLMVMGTHSQEPKGGSDLVL